MQPELINKIKETLDLDLDRYKLIYLLSKIRKLIEANSQEKQYIILYFYANWALHPMLDRSTKVLIEMGLCDNIQEIDVHIDFMVHRNFLIELSQFCEEYLHGQQIVTLNNRVEFMKLLENELAETPLRFTREKYEVIIKKFGEDDYYWHGRCI